MIRIRDAYQRFQVLIHEGFKFLVVGGVGTVVTIAGAVALHGIGKYLAVTVATIAGAAVTFLGNRYWSFRHRQARGTAHETLMFVLLNAIGLLIYYGCIWILQDLIGLGGKIWYTVALVLGTGLGTVFRFWSYRKWVWVAQHHHHDEPETEPGAGFPEYLDLAIARDGLQDSFPTDAAVSTSSAASASRPAAVGHAATHRATGSRTLSETIPASTGATPRNRPGAHRRT